MQRDENAMKMRSNENEIIREGETNKRVIL